MTTRKQALGLDDPGARKIPITVRDWNAMKLALWRGRIGWEIAGHAALEILGRCEHSEGCPGIESETEPCTPTCPDREARMSALVVLNAARTCAPKNVHKPAEGSYFAPSREYFSEVLSELETTKFENDALREALRRAGVEVPLPPDDGLTLKELMSTTTEPRLEEKTA